MQISLTEVVQISDYGRNDVNIDEKYISVMYHEVGNAYLAVICCGQSKLQPSRENHEGPRPRYIPT